MTRKERYHMLKKMIAIALLLLLVAGTTSCQRRDKKPEEESSEIVSVSEAEESGRQEEEPPAEESESSEESSQEDTTEVEAAAREMLGALQTGDRDSIKAQLDYTNLLQLQQGQSDVNHLAILRRLQYEIEDVDISGSTATVTIKLTNLDMTVVMASYLKAAAELEFNNNTSDQPRTQAELDADYVRLFEDTLDANSANTTVKSVPITFLQVGGGWKAQVSSGFRDAALGNYFTAQGQMGINEAENQP